MKTNWDALQEALNGLRKNAPKGFTSEEFAKALGLYKTTAHNKLRELVTKGKVKFVGHRSTTRIDGKPTQTPVYAEAKK